MNRFLKTAAFRVTRLVPKALALSLILGVASAPVYAQFTPSVMTTFDSLDAGQATGFDQTFTFFAGQPGPAMFELSLDRGSFDYTGISAGDTIANLVVPVFLDNPFPLPDISGDIVGIVQVVAITGSTLQAEAVVDFVDPALVPLLGLLGIADPTGEIAFFVEYTDNSFDSGGSIVVTDAGVLPTGGSLTIDLPFEWDTFAPMFVQSPAGGTLTGTTSVTSVDMDTTTVVETFTLVGGGSMNAFIRGDVSGDGMVLINDGVFLLAFLFSGGQTPGCNDAADVNDDGAIAIDDAITVLAALFLGGPIPDPSPSCGTDPTADSLDCAVSSMSCP